MAKNEENPSSTCIALTHLSKTQPKPIFWIPNSSLIKYANRFHEKHNNYLTIFQGKGHINVTFASRVLPECKIIKNTKIGIWDCDHISVMFVTEVCIF